MVLGFDVDASVTLWAQDVLVLSMFVFEVFFLIRQGKSFIVYFCAYPPSTFLSLLWWKYEQGECVVVGFDVDAWRCHRQLSLMPAYVCQRQLPVER